MKLPSDSNDNLSPQAQWKYYRAAKRDITKYLLSDKEFTEWRNLCFDEDCSILLDQLDATSFPVPAELSKFPFGCVIEAIGVKPFSCSTLRQHYHDEFHVEIKVNVGNGKSRWVLSEGKENERKVVDSEEFGGAFHQNLRRQIKVGHVLHHKTEFWNSLFAGKINNNTNN